VTFAAVILAGGAARRLGGAVKPLLTIEGSALLTRVLAAASDTEPRIVVGPGRLRPELPAGTALTCEQPPGAGPVAAIRAGLALVPPTAAAVAILAADLPFLTAGTLGALRTALETSGGDVAVLLDAEGRRQNLVAVWHVGALRAALSLTVSPAVRDLFSQVRVTETPSTPDPRPAWFDCDTPEELARARRLASRS
jgi:molybdopterin-guanine dinucleotide biosynthesis protein A